MKNIFFAFMILIIAPSGIQANNKYNFKFGGNFSKIQENNSEQKIGITFGIGKNWDLFHNFKIGSDLLFTTRGGVLKDKPISNNPKSAQDIYTYNIHACIGYLELPLTVKHFIYESKKINITLNIGSSIAIPVLDFSKTTNGKFLFHYIPGDPNNLIDNFEYGWNNDSEFYSKKVYYDILYNLGVGIKLSAISFELRYSIGNRYIGPVELITPIHRKLHSFHFVVTYSL